LKPVTRDDVIRRIPELTVRFSFMDQKMGQEQTVQFLREFAKEVADYLPSLRQNLESHRSEMRHSARLALDCGIPEYELTLSWARKSIELYERKRKTRYEGVNSTERASKPI
jgi:hypothetical protein